MRLRGDQLDLKPMLQRFFSLSGDLTGGPQATAVDQTIAVDLELKRALGFYKTTAFNVNLDLVLRGADPAAGEPRRPTSAATAASR